MSKYTKNIELSVKLCYNLKYTIQRRLTSKGKSLQDKGLTPDVEVEQSKEYYENKTDENDAQLQKALEILNKRES